MLAEACFSNIHHGCFGSITNGGWFSCSWSIVKATECSRSIQCETQNARSLAYVPQVQVLGLRKRYKSPRNWLLSGAAIIIPNRRKWWRGSSTMSAAATAARDWSACKNNQISNISSSSYLKNERIALESEREVEWIRNISSSQTTMAMGTKLYMNCTLYIQLSLISHIINSF